MSVFAFSPGFAAALCAAVTVLGLCLGSFLNCQVLRLAARRGGKTVQSRRSCCPHCSHPLGPAELVPVLSYLVLRGRCRWCGGRISPRYPASELIAGAICLLSLLRFGFGWEALRAAGFGLLLLAAALMDLDTLTIPDRFPGMLWWLVTLPLLLWERHALTWGSFGRELLQGVLGGLSIGVPLLFLSLLVSRRLGRESLGGGDLKLLFAVGCYLGPAPALMSLILACVFGLAMGLLRKKESIPFGPAIGAAAFLTLLWGGWVLAGYLSLF